MLSLILLILGFFVGSFLGVLIDRIPRGEKFSTGRSYCESCKRVLGVLDLIPVFSFLLLKGRCRYCHAPFSPYYLVIEIATGISFAATPYLISFTNSLYLGTFLIILSLLLVILFTDLKYGIIPDKVLFPATLVAFAWIILTNQPILLNLLSGFGSFLFFLAIFLLTKGRGMGFGDVKLSFLLGLLLGFPSAVFAIYLAFLTGSLVSVTLIVLGRKKLKGTTIAFGPFLVFGILLNLYFVDEVRSTFLGAIGMR